MAKVKNATLADGDAPEPAARVIGETQVVDAADRLIANTAEEADAARRPLRRRPRPGRGRAPRRRPRRLPPRAAGLPPARGSGVAPDAIVLLFVGPDPAAEGAGHAACAPSPRWWRRTRRCATAAGRRRRRAERIRAGAPAGAAGARGRARRARPGALRAAGRRGRGSRTGTARPTVWSCPSYSESFGLVAVEAQACGTPVVAAARGRSADRRRRRGQRAARRRARPLRVGRRPGRRDHRPRPPRPLVAGRGAARRRTSAGTPPPRRPSTSTATPSRTAPPCGTAPCPAADRRRGPLARRCGVASPS